MPHVTDCPRVSRMTENVLRRFVDPKPFRMPLE
jgi:hypothetical protein